MSKNLLLNHRRAQRLYESAKSAGIDLSRPTTGQNCWIIRLPNFEIKASDLFVTPPHYNVVHRCKASHCWNPEHLNIFPIVHQGVVVADDKDLFDCLDLTPPLDLTHIYERYNREYPDLPATISDIERAIRRYRPGVLS